MAKALLDWETIDADQINDIMAGRPPRPPKPSPNVVPPPRDSGPSAAAPTGTPRRGQVSLGRIRG